MTYIATILLPALIVASVSVLFWKRKKRNRADGAIIGPDAVNEDRPTPVIADQSTSDNSI